MKAKILGTALFATLVLGVNLAHADEKAPTDLTTSGKVTVQDGSLDPGDGPIDPEDPGTFIPVDPGDEDEPIVPNPGATGPLEITHAANLDFNIVKTSTTEIVVNADPIEFNNSKGDKQIRGAAYVQFGDLRTAQHGYTVSAKMTKQFTNSKAGTSLNGAMITLTNPYAATYKDPNAVTTTQVTEAPTLENTVLLQEGKAATIATANNSHTSGKGLWAIEYGSTADVDNGVDTTKKSVQLKIPAVTASTMVSGKYEATIEWSIAATPS